MVCCVLLCIVQLVLMLRRAAIQHSNPEFVAQDILLWALAASYDRNGRHVVGCSGKLPMPAYMHDIWGRHA